ncbi:MAG: hypothetical protein AB7F66_03815 [Bacteriovoracia bacterium]
MKTPLQHEKEQFLISSKGRLIGWGRKDVKNLIKNANRAKSEGLLSKQSLTLNDAECIFAYEWFDTFLVKGITEEVIKKLNSRITHIHYRHVLMHSSNRGPYWRRIADGDQIDDPELSVAYGIAHLLAVGAFDGLKRCRMQTCQRFFIGRPDAKWCTKACGSRHRVYQKRKRDKNRQLE